MKIIVTYDIGIEVEIPDERINEIINNDYYSHNRLDCGRALHCLIRHYSPEVRMILEMADGEITGVYKYDDVKKPFDEIVWE